MDIREVIEKCKPFAPVVSAAVVAACVAGSLYGYEAPVYEMKASVEDTQEQEDEVPVVKTSTEEETKEDEAAEEEEQAKGSFDMEDGVYQGTGTGYRGNITVAVTIKDKQITSIEILSASDDEPFFGRAKGLIDQIIKKQSTKVDTVSGATYSSKGIISAVKNALTGEKDSGTTGSSQEGTSASQSQSTPEAVGSVQEPAAYKDGTYYGTGTGFAGNLKVEVVISGGKISNIQIVETNDGSEYIQKASGVINQILGAQSTNGIDTVSGATFSSNGIIKAVRNALSQAAADNGGNFGSDGTNTVNKENTENNTTAVTGTLPYNDGVYYGTAEGYNGDITVAIVIQEKTLKAVLVIGEEDDDAFFGRAMDVVTQMMKKQSTEVDTVSGATYSSKGLIQAVKNALEEAKRVTNGETDTADDNNGVQLNTGEVEKVIDAVNELNGGDYTSASWAVVKVRLKDARKALKNATEQAQLDEAAAQLNQAIAELRISDGTNEDPEPDLPPESTYIDGVYPVTVLCLPDADMDFEAYNLFAQVTIQDDKIIKIDNVYGDGGSGNDSYINKAVNGTSSKTGVVKQITEKGNLDGIDTVSRATCTSQAIIDACQQAFNNAKRQ